MNEKKRCYVIAARNHTDLADMTFNLALAGVDFSVGRGFYAGRYEPVALVVTDSQHIPRVIARLHGQRSYLAVSENDRQAYDVDVDTGYHKALGKLCAVDANQARDLDAWTDINGQYYSTTGRVGADLPEGF